jgi:uncharacterized protein YndB with AHSA1/START domain
MSIDFNAHLGAATRSVSVLEREGKPARGVTLERTYSTTPDDLWDALTNPERLPRWFLPVSGDLKPGGRYQLEGNAGGTITQCVPPRALSLTWEFGGGMSWVEVRLTPEGAARSRLTLCHICPVDDFWSQYGPGAVGVGWDLGLLGLETHLSSGGAAGFDENAVIGSPEGKVYIAEASADWGRAAVAAGEDAARAEAAAKQTTAFYTGAPVPGVEPGSG